MSEPRGKVAVAVALVVFIAGTTLAFLAFTKDDGADSPEEAANAMINAVASGDALAVFEQLPPGERRALQDGTLALAEQLEQLGLITTFDPAALDSARPTFDDLRMMTTEIGKDTTAIDLVGGTVTMPVAADGQPPLTDRGREILGRLGVDVDPNATSYRRDFAEEPFRLMTIREGGGWHVSLAYTLAEVLRSAAEVPLPEMGKGPPGQGAETPDEAVSDLLTAYANNDLDGVVRLMYPDEARSLYDYAPAFLPPSEARAAAAAADGTYDVQLNDIQTSTTGSGPTRQVRVTGFDLDVRDELQKTHVTYDGRCLHTDRRINDEDDPFAKSDVCDGDWGPGDPEARHRNSPVANLAIFGGGADLPTFTVIEKQGRWYISPARSLLTSMVDTLAALPADKLDVFADRLAASWRAGVGDGLSADPIAGGLPAEASEEERQLARMEALIDACGGLADGPAAAAVEQSCIDRLVATGKIHQIIADANR